MHEIVAKSILSAKNNINPYRGCTHGCIYCDSRSECYGMTYTFEDIGVKTNAPQLLEQALHKKRERGVITTGAMTDPYLPLEAEKKITRQCLEVIEKERFGAAVLTKSDLVLRDIELLQRIHHRGKAVAQMTLTTFDEALCQKLEPHVATTARRLQVLGEMHKAGIPTVVWLTPILPFINDTAENVQGILEGCAKAGVHGIITFGVGMTLRAGNREYYYRCLDECFPGLKKEYMHHFGSSYGLKSPHSRALEKQIKTFCAKAHIAYGTKEVFAMVSDMPTQSEQMTFW